MNKRIVITLLIISIAGSTASLIAGFRRVSDVSGVATGQTSVSSRYTGRVAQGTPVGQAADTQMQKIEGVGQQKLQSTKGMQRVQQTRTQATQPMQNVQSRFGGSKFF